jgi:hypothetical protein
VKGAHFEVVTRDADFEYVAGLDAKRFEVRAVERDPDAAADEERLAFLRLLGSIQPQGARALLGGLDNASLENLLTALGAAVAGDGELAAWKGELYDCGLAEDALLVVRAFDGFRGGASR